MSVRTDPLPVALTFDVESDNFDPTVDPAQADVRAAFLWRGVHEGVPQLLELFAAPGAQSARPIVCTWFIRVDGHLQATFGDAGYLLDEHAALWRQVADRGDELAFHPHLYRFAGGRWQQEQDPEQLVRGIADGLSAMRRRGWRPVSSRIGEAYCSNAILRQLDAEGIACDATAMPGRVRRDADRLLDWGPTRQRPYRPSQSDYRVPGEPSWKVLEVPMTMTPVRADYDQSPLSRYVDLSFHPRALRDGLQEVAASHDYVVATMHPSTIVPPRDGRTHGLLSFSFDAFRENLACLVDACGRQGRPVEFVTLRELARRFGGGA